jgi:hypothetical protein
LVGGNWVYFTLRCYLGFAGLEVIGSYVGFNKGRGVWITLSSYFAFVSHCIGIRIIMNHDLSSSDDEIAEISGLTLLQ